MSRCVLNEDFIMNCRGCFYLDRSYEYSEELISVPCLRCKAKKAIFPSGENCPYSRCKSLVYLYKAEIGKKESREAKGNYISCYYIIAESVESAKEKAKLFLPWLYLYDIQQLSPSDAANILIKTNYINSDNSPIVINKELRTRNLPGRHQPTEEQLKNAMKANKGVRK